MPGDDTVTSTVAASVAMKPAMVADTVVVPLAKGSKAAPPAGHRGGRVVGPLGNFHGHALTGGRGGGQLSHPGNTIDYRCRQHSGACPYGLGAGHRRIIGTGYAHAHIKRVVRRQGRAGGQQPAQSDRRLYNFGGIGAVGKTGCRYGDRDRTGGHPLHVKVGGPASVGDGHIDERGAGRGRIRRDQGHRRIAAFNPYRHATVLAGSQRKAALLLQPRSHRRGGIHGDARR